MAIEMEDHFKDLANELLHNFNDINYGLGSLTGTKASLVIPDEIGFEIKEVQAVYETPAFPLATVKVYKRVDRFIIKVGDRQVGREYNTLALAKPIASDMHKKLVAKLTEVELAVNPNFVKF